MEKINKILIIQLRQIGDVLLSTPLVRELKENREGCHIVFLTEKIPAQVLYNNPYIDEIQIFEKNKNPLEELKFFLSLRKYNFDLVIDLLGTPGTALASLLCGAPRRAGYAFRGRKYAYNMKIHFNSELKYNALRKLDILELFGINTKSHKLILQLTEKDRFKAENFFKENRFAEDDFTVAVSPTSRRQARRWTQKGYAGLVKLLIKQYNAKVVFLWGPGEFEYVSEIISMTDDKLYVVPDTTVREMAAFIEKSHLLISNDNGQKHMATAFGVPTITVFGPTSEVVWNPPEREKYRIVQGDVECIKCGKQECETHICMEAVTPQLIINELRQIKELERFIHS